MLPYSARSSCLLISSMRTPSMRVLRSPVKPSTPARASREICFSSLCMTSTDMPQSSALTCTQSHIGSAGPNCASRAPLSCQAHLPKHAAICSSAPFGQPCAHASNLRMVLWSPKDREAFLHTQSRAYRNRLFRHQPSSRPFLVRMLSAYHGPYCRAYQPKSTENLINTVTSV